MKNNKHKQFIWRKNCNEMNQNYKQRKNKADRSYVIDSYNTSDCSGTYKL